MITGRQTGVTALPGSRRLASATKVSLEAKELESNTDAVQQLASSLRELLPSRDYQRLYTKCTLYLSWFSDAKGFTNSIELQIYILYIYIYI